MTPTALSVFIIVGCISSVIWGIYTWKEMGK